MSRKISIITPWLDHPEFIADYESSTRAPDVDVIVVDNASNSDNAKAAPHDLMAKQSRLQILEFMKGGRPSSSAPGAGPLRS